VNSDPNKNERLERALKHLEPEKPVQGDADEGRLDLSLIVLQGVHKGCTTPSALTEYCRGTDADPRSTPLELGSVIQELVEDGLLEVRATEEESIYSLTLMGRTVLDLE
jgi:hypothetical protein